MAARRVPYMLSSAEVGCRGSNGGSPIQSIPRSEHRRSTHSATAAAAHSCRKYNEKKFSVSVGMGLYKLDAT